MEINEIEYWNIKLQLIKIGKLFFEDIPPYLVSKYFNTVLDQVDAYLYIKTGDNG